MSKELLETVRCLYAGNSTIAHFANVGSRPVGVCRGLGQGSPLLPILCLLYVSGLEQALLESGLGFRLKYSTREIEENRRLPGLTITYDVVFMAETKVDLQALLDISATEMTELGLRQENLGCTVRGQHG
ncbi:hypothetical protein MRX96_035538 [Rhipicephalus microplus]